jgi:hypothetical protein
MANNKKVLVTGALVAITLVIVVLVVVITPVAIIFSQDSSPETGTQDSSPPKVKLHVNPVDPIIMTAETPDGETIYMLGSKTADGVPVSISEFLVENENGSTYVTMGSDGSVSSAVNTDGLRLDFIWGENFTMLQASLVSENGSEHMSNNIDLSEPVNFTDFEGETNIHKRDVGNGIPVNVDAFKRNLKRNDYAQLADLTSPLAKRQSENQNFVRVAISVESCEMPEPNARVFADVLLDYDEGTGRSSSSTRYTGVKTRVPGQYLVRIPASAPSDQTGMLCDGIERALGVVCDTNSKFIGLFSENKADGVICFRLASELSQPSRKPFRAINRLCRTAFRGLKVYCEYLNKDSGNGNTPGTAMVPCGSIPLIDNGIDLMQQDVLLTPSAVFPQGNTVTAQGRVLHLSSGSSTVREEFDIKNRVRITRFDILPIDPAPGEDYDIAVSYECYSRNLQVLMSVIGTDGYDSRISCTTGPSCQLHIPGGDALVQDLINVTIHDAPTTIERRTIVTF